MKKFKKTDTRAIEDIDPISGVTANQLFKQCKYLIQRIKKAKPLTRHQQQTAINDTVIKVMDMMNRGLVPNKNYQEFKGYLFISLRSACLLNYTQKTYRKNSLIQNAEDYQLLSEDFEILDGYKALDDKEQFKVKLDKIERINEIIKQFSQTEQSIFNDYINGLSFTAIIKKYGVSRGWFSSMVKKIQVRIKNQPPAMKRRETKEISDLERKYLDFIDIPPLKNKTARKKWVFEEKMESGKFVELTQNEQIDYLFDIGYKLTTIADYYQIPLKDIYRRRESIRRKNQRKRK